LGVEKSLIDDSFTSEIFLIFLFEKKIFGFFFVEIFYFEKYGRKKILEKNSSKNFQTQKSGGSEEIKMILSPIGP